MPILILSSENKDLEQEIAEKIAKKLSYTTINEHFLNKIADKHLLERKKMWEAMHSTPSILKRMSPKLWHYSLSCVELEVLERLVEDRCVCWGLAAHLYVMIVSHVLKVRLIGRNDSCSQSDIVKMAPDKMKKYLARQERDREKWSMKAFNRKEAEPGLYDMVINLDQIQVDEAVNTLSMTMEYPRFKAMTYSKNNLMDHVLAARVKNALLVKSMTDIHVHTQNGRVVVTTSSVKREKSRKIETIKEIASHVKGIGYLEVHWNKDIITEAAISCR
ncbi:cytidylate kinase family protein [Desulfobacula sp.]|uniref:cytidylate kinase-like family protein n=1 Tax=Desulfobacula sp. TaxID=2593537 RepID=UPI00262A9BD3|nr:cytidylate kinase family protein [Desulfobacula sp.]